MITRTVCAFFAVCLAALLCGCAGGNGTPDNSAWMSAPVTCTTADCTENDPMRTEEGIDTINSGGWSKSGVLNMGDPVDQVTMQANFPDANVYTVQFSVTPPPAIGGVIPIPTTRATVMWNINGNFNTRVVDVGNGVSLTGVANAVKVIVQDLSPNPGGNPAYTVDVTVARGPRVQADFPPTLFGGRVVGVAPGAAFVITVPVNAGVVSAEVAVSENGVATPNVTVLQQGGTTQKSYDATNPPTFVPLRAGVVTQLRIVNHDAANNVDITVTWGIDG